MYIFYVFEVVGLYELGIVAPPKKLHSEKKLMMPQNLYRFAYASRSTFKPFNTKDGVDVNIAQILQVARKNNQKNNLVGALYYGNGCFFQCLEGDKQAIDTLYAKLLNDPRHKDLKVLLSVPIDKTGFSSWEMKFATIDNEVRQFLREHDAKKFDPYQFDANSTQQLVSMLQKADDALTQHQLDEAARVDVSNQTQGSHYTPVFIVALLVAIVFAAALFLS